MSKDRYEIFAEDRKNVCEVIGEPMESMICDGFNIFLFGTRHDFVVVRHELGFKPDAILFTINPPIKDYCLKLGSWFIERWHDGHRWDEIEYFEDAICSAKEYLGIEGLKKIKEVLDKRGYLGANP